MNTVNSISTQSLILIHLFSVGNSLGLFVMNLSEVANGTTSIQRMEEYIECDDFEAEFETPEAKSSWPRTG